MSDQSTYDERRQAACDFAAKLGERISQVALAPSVTWAVRESASRHPDVEAASGAYLEAWWAYVDHGGPETRNALRDSADALVAAWRNALTPERIEQAGLFAAPMPREGIELDRR